MYKILFADDEKKLRDTVTDYMTAKGFVVTAVADGNEAVEAVRDGDFDLLILDVMMPDCGGLDALKEIRAFSDVPALFLSALGQETDLLRAYALGADDYVVKPYPLAVLCQKCAALISRYRGGGEDGVWQAWPIKLDTRQMTVTGRDGRYPVTGKDFQLLLYLIRNERIVLGREKILLNVWGWDYDGNDRVVDTHVKRLRKALGRDSVCIRTVIGVGYTFDPAAAKEGEG